MPLTRRTFLTGTALGTSTIIFGGLRVRSAADGKTSANDKLNVAVIGVANQGGYNLNSVASQNIVALCDVDDTYLNKAAEKFPAAKKYHDFRKLIDQNGIDAIVIATPDHTHAVASVAALKSGRHLYCEKPLTRTISECRFVTDLARKQKRVTQLGTQIHAQPNYRRVVELIQTGAVGAVREVHVWVGSNYGGTKKRPTEAQPIPAHLHYDLWLGPVEEVPYHSSYVPFNWRNWWAFGGGSLADFGCHFMDLPFWALNLKYPLSAEAEGPEPHPDQPPTSLAVRYQFPARAKTPETKVDMPALRLTWYHGGKRRDLLKTILTEEQAKKWGGGVLFVGDKGMLLSDYGKHVLLPENDFVGFERPAPFIKDSIGHHKEWIEACKNGSVTTCNFDYSGPLTEAALLGNVAFRAGRKIEWDAAKLKAKGFPDADQYIQHRYRKGWSLA